MVIRVKNKEREFFFFKRLAGWKNVCNFAATESTTASLSSWGM